MPPLRGAALIPLLTVLGTTAAAAVVAHKYVPAYFANKHAKRRDEHNEPDDPKPEMTSPTVEQPAPAPVKAVHETRASRETRPTRSSEVVGVLMQDPYLLISAFGACVMVLAVLVSLALVELRDDVASLNDLQMFGPLMLVAMGLISLGMVLSMANPKPVVALPEPEEEEDVVEAKPPSPEEAAALKNAAQEGNQGFLYNYYKNKYANEPTEVEVDGEDGQPKKRVSRCPFGFT